MATLSLKERMAQAKAARAKQQTGVSKVERVVAQSTTPVRTATTATVDDPLTATGNSLGNAMAGLSKQIAENNTKLAAHIRSQEEKGVYQFNDKIRGVEGLDADEFISKMQMLDQATVDKTPEIRTFMLQIRKNLQQYPELTHILTDEQLHIVVGGALFISGEELAPKTKAAKTRKDNLDIKELSSMDIKDLF